MSLFLENHYVHHSHPFCLIEILALILQGLSIRGYLRLTPTLPFSILTWSGFWHTKQMVNLTRRKQRYALTVLELIHVKFFTFWRTPCFAIVSRAAHPTRPSWWSDPSCLCPVLWLCLQTTALSPCLRWQLHLDRSSAGKHLQCNLQFLPLPFGIKHYAAQSVGSPCVVVYSDGQFCFRAWPDVSVS